MERSQLLLIFTAVVVLILVGYGLYAKLSAPPPPPPGTTTDATTRPTLVDRLREERDRRMRDRGELPATFPATTTTGPAL